MTTFLNVLGVVILLSFLVIIHELGHYWAARRNGIKVLEFGIGFPPRLFKWKKGDTTWSFNLIPFGGFVRLHGEDSSDPKVLKDKESFASKTPWQKLEVVLAGVFMNFLVFWVLMSLALMNGVNPVFTSADDYRAAFLDGTVQATPGVLVEEVVAGSAASVGVSAYSKLVEINDEAVDSLDDIEMIKQSETGSLLFENPDGSTYDLNYGKGQSLESLGVELYPSTYLPVVNVTEVSNDSRFNGFLESGDVLVSVNSVPVLDVEAMMIGFYSKTDNGKLNLLVQREGRLVEYVLNPIDQNFVVSDIMADSAAHEAGVLPGDILLAVNGTSVSVGDEIYKLVEGEDQAIYSFDRGGEQVNLTLEPNDDGRIGVVLSPQFDLASIGLKFYTDGVVGSVTQIRQTQVPIYEAPFAALSQGWVIAESTAKAFMSTLFKVATNLEVSEEVGGPVQVAKLSYHFVNEGGVELLSFIALISLSLAVINILPIPALDGGRLLFIIVEAFRRKPLNPKIEGMIHAFGFILLMGFILVVTVYDIIRA